MGFEKVDDAGDAAPLLVERDRTVVPLHGLGGMPADRPGHEVANLRRAAQVLEGAAHPTRGDRFSKPRARATARNGLSSTLRVRKPPWLPGDSLANLLSDRDFESKITLHSATNKDELVALASACGAIGVIEKTDDDQSVLAQLQRCLQPFN